MELKWQITDDVIARRFGLADAKHIFPVVDRNRGYLRQWLPWLDFNVSVFDSRDFVRDALVGYRNNESLHLGLWANDGNEFIGVCGFHTIKDGSAKLGYWIDEKWQGNGIILASCQKFIDYAFNDLEVNEIVIRAATGNLASKIIAEKLNMHYKETIKDAEWLYDHYVDHHIYNILKQNYKN